MQAKLTSAWDDNLIPSTSGDAASTDNDPSSSRELSSIVADQNPMSVIVVDPNWRVPEQGPRQHKSD